MILKGLGAHELICIRQYHQYKNSIEIIQMCIVKPYRIKNMMRLRLEILKQRKYCRSIITISHFIQNRLKED